MRQLAGTLIFLLLPVVSRSQHYFSDHFGGTLGLTLHFGSHVNAAGLNLKVYYTDYFFQVNAGTSLTFHSLSYGNRRKYIENRSAFGLMLLGGKKQMPVDFQLDGLNHQTAYNLGIGYNYVLYRDNAGTSQNSGGIAFHIRHISVYHENDFLAGQGKDRFRTAHFFISYRNDFYRTGAGILLWTGETAGARRENIQSAKAPNGFKILEDLPYGKTSHGIFYGSFRAGLPFGQQVYMRLGIDSEHIRHAIQNRLIHDLAFIPGLTKRTRRTTPHYPRLNSMGCPVFSKEGVRPDALYLQFGANSSWAD